MRSEMNIERWGNIAVWVPSQGDETPSSGYSIGNGARLAGFRMVVCHELSLQNAIYIDRL